MKARGNGLDVYALLRGLGIDFGRDGQKRHGLEVDVVWYH